MSEQRNPALDGIRGIAILLVMITHLGVGISPTGPASAAWLNLAQFGWVGVDVFFVLSGFLITGILLETRDDRSYFRNFYLRRILRIFPLYYATVAFLLFASLLAGGHGTLGAQLGNAWTHQAWLWTYCVNWGNGLHQPYPAAGVFTTHFWSLAIEEQFYLLWPFVVWLTPREKLRTVCVGVGVAGIALRFAVLLHGDYWLAFLSTATRLDGLLIGAWLASARADRLDIQRIERRAILGALCLLPLALIHPALALGLGVTAVSIITAGLIQYAVESPASRWLAARPLVTLGAYSYGLYMLHVPIRRFLDFGFGLNARALQTYFGSAVAGSFAMIVIGGSLSFLAALASWHLLEKRCLALKRFFPRQSSPVPKLRPITAEGIQYGPRILS